MGAPAVSAASLRQSLASAQPPLVIDVRRDERFREAPDLVRGALRRDPARVADWAKTLPGASSVVVYCVHGHEVSQNTAKLLNEQGLSASYLEGGVEEWKKQSGATVAKPHGASTRWVTRERPKIDRIACPWLVRRFIDPEAEFLYVPTPDVMNVAREKQAVPYDIPDVEFSHEGELCSFDAFLKFYRLRDPALDELARIVRGADTGQHGLTPQSPGLLAISLGLSLNFPNDHEMLEQGMVMYDALYSWCKGGKEEKHTWNPDLYK
jgi:rhodanese-related sulfurtransferase